MAFVDRLGSLPVPSADIAIKAPVRVATGANVTLNGLQSIDGITVAAGDRVLLYGQTDARQNGIYAASTGNWTRTIDANGNTDLLAGTEVFVIMGVTNSGNRFVQTCTDNPVVIGTSLIGFSAATAGFAGLNIRPPGSSLGVGLTITQSLHGSSLPPGNALNLIFAVSDDAQFGSGFGNLLEVSHQYGGPNMTGGRQTGFFVSNFTAASSASNPERDYVALSSQMIVNSGDNGTNTGAGALGAFFALGPAIFVTASAQNLLGVNSAELDTFVAAGASMKYLFGTAIVGCNAAHGALIDAALAVGGQPAVSSYGPHAGWNQVFVVTDAHGASPVNASTKLFTNYWTGGGTKSIATGFDLSGFSISGNAWASTNASISGAGAASFASLTLSTVLSVANGGTGASSITAHGVVLGNGSNPLSVTAAGAGGTVLQGVAAADPIFTATPTLGISGSVLGKIGFAGNTSGSATIQPQAAAGTPILTLPNASGTFAVSATAPIALSATTGALTLNANGVTYAFMQQASASRLLGNPTGGTANVSEITLGATLAFSGSALQTTALSGDVTSSANSFATTIAAGAVSLSKMANLAANSIIGNNTGSAATPSALSVAQAQALLGYPMILGGFADGVNANAVGDTAITISCPTANYRIAFVVTQNTGTTASLTTAQYGIFSAVGGGGTTISGAGSSLSALTSNTVNSAGSVQSQAAANSAAYNFTTLYFRISTAQGAPATINVYIYIMPLP